jgi:hypothetical protein
MKRLGNKKVSAPKVVAFNRLIDAELLGDGMVEEGPVTEYEFVRDEPL